MLTLSDSFPSSCPTEHNPKHLDLDSLKELPDSYAWSQEEKTSTSSCGGQESVPVIDLNDPNAINLIGHACKTWGVFQITNHGIPNELLRDIECAEKKLFSLPLQQKLKASRPPDGVSGYGVARISSFFRKLMWSEGFTIVGPPLQHACQLWPQQDYGMTFCHVIENYQKGMKQLAGRLMWLMLCSLGIDKVDVKWAGPKQDFSGACDVIQLNHYPACPDPDRAMGLAAHTDSSLLTILHQNDTSGLQVFREGIGWILVPPISGALVINVGDLFHILSNGLYPSVLHRAVVNRTKHRFSAAYLYGPPSSVEISPLPDLTGPTHPPLFRPVTWNEYLNTKGKHFNKALSWVRVRVPINGLHSVKDNCVKIS